MKLNNALIARIAGAAMALSMAVPALAQDSTPPEAPPAAPQTETVAAPLPTTTSVSSYNVQIDPHLPLPLIIGGALLLLGATAASRNVRGAFVKAGAGTAVVVTLLNPQLVTEDRAQLPTEVAIVIDRSASQTIDGRAAATAEAHRELLERLSAIEGVNVRTVEAGRPQDGNVGDGTQIFTTLAQGLTDVAPDRLGAVIILTDGQVHDVTDSNRAIAPGVPVHVVVSGREDERDRRIVLEQAPSFGLVNKEQTIRFRVVEDGSDSREPVRVNITVDGKEVESRMVVPGESTEVTLTLGHAGNNIVALDAAALEGELTTVNNRVATSIKGVRDKLRVLLVSGAPTASERSWRALLKSDPDLDLIHFTILRSPSRQDATPLNEMSLIEFPTRELFEEKLEDFDLVVFDHYQPNVNPSFSLIANSYLENVARYVDNGGALLVLSGPEAAAAHGLHTTPLGRVLPAVPTGQVIEMPFRPDVSDMGDRHPVTRTLEAAQGPLPWGSWYRQVDANVMPQGTVVMNGANDRPLAVLARQGEGRVGMILSDDAWMWARGIDGGGPFASMMKRYAHWLMKEPDLEEEALRMSVQNGELTIERQTMAEEVEPVTITTPSGTEVPVTLSAVTPGTWRATIPAAEQGLYFAAQGQQNAVINSGPISPREFADARSTTEVMRPLAEGAGGVITRMGTAGNIDIPRITPVYNKDAAVSGPDWIGLRMSMASDLQGTDRYAPFSGWLAFMLVVGLMAGAYWREGEKVGRRLADSVNKMLGRSSGPSM